MHDFSFLIEKEKKKQTDVAGVKMDEIKKCVGIFKLDGERMKDLKSNLLR